MAIEIDPEVPDRPSMRLFPDETDHVYRTGDTIKLICEADYPLDWKLPSILETRDYVNISIHLLITLKAFSQQFPTIVNITNNRQSPSRTNWKIGLLSWTSSSTTSRTSPHPATTLIRIAQLWPCPKLVIRTRVTLLVTIGTAKKATKKSKRTSTSKVNEPFFFDTKMSRDET